MSLKDCIRSAQAQGHITLEEALELERRYDQLVRHLNSRGLARDQLIEELEAEAFERRRRALLTETRRGELEAALAQHRDARGNPDPANAFRYLHEHQGQARFEDIEHKRLAIIAQAHADMEEMLFEFRRGAFAGDKRRQAGSWFANTRTVVRLENVVRELFGRDSGDARAKHLAASWSRVAEDLRQRFNAAGGAIGRLKDWGLPQSHNPEALMRAGFDAWKAFIEPRLDRARMVHPVTGRQLTDDELADTLRVVYDRITTDGWIDRQPSGVPAGRGALFRQHADHRFLHFKDPDAWLDYARTFGEGDPFAAMMGHINTMARDIAAMEILGPNPESMRTYLKQLVLQQTRNDPTAQVILFRADEMWAHMRGAANTPVSARWANVLAGTRNFITASRLGKAAITSLSDLGTQAITRRFNGLRATRTFADVVRQFSRENRREAVRAGLILDAALHTLHQQARYVGALSGPEWTRWLSDRALTFSGLSPFTQAGKHAFGLEVQGFLADQVAHLWTDLPAPVRRMLDRHGFTADDWDAMRAMPLYTSEGGAPLLRPAEMAAAGRRDLAERYIAMILRETIYAIPETTVGSQSLATGSTRPGTLLGELARSGMQFKSFPVTFAMLHGGRVFREIASGSIARGAVYAGGLLITLTLFGALSLQLKEIIGGRDPRKMTPMDKEGRDFWGAALLQGGGAGIYGDFLFADVNRFGGGLARTVAGPIWDTADDLRKLTIGNVFEFAQGKEKTSSGRELVNFLRSHTPGGTTWYLQLAYERVVLDQLQHLMDPDARAAFRRRMDTRRRDFGQDFWWRPGETAPRRGPALAR